MLVEDRPDLFFEEIEVFGCELSGSSQPGEVGTEKGDCEEEFRRIYHTEKT